MRMVLSFVGMLELRPTSQFQDRGAQQWSLKTSGDYRHYFDSLPTAVSVRALVEM